MQREMKVVPYNVGIESIIFATVAMRTNIAFAMNMVSQFMSKAGPPHWMAVKCMMRYLKGTLDFKLCLIGMDIAFEGFCNAKLGGECKQPAIHLGICIFCRH